MVRKFLSTLFTLIIISGAKAQVPGEWVWVSGLNFPNNAGSFGLPGEIDSTFYPPALYEAAEWTDLNYNFWVFGGNTTTNMVNSLFFYDRAYSRWGIMTGTTSSAQPGVYGTKGVPSPSNTPGARAFGAMTWTDKTGDLWLFGGLGLDKNGNTGELADLWKYTIATNQWTWMAGPDTLNTTGNYGVKGQAAAANFPPGRYNNAATWVDSLNNLWLFGGLIGTNIYKNDLWKYDTGLNQWIWISGDQAINVTANYGVKGVEDSLNEPGGRYSYTRYSDGDDNLYLYGSEATKPSTTLTTDVWKYNMSNGLWSWVAGTGTPFPFGNYVSTCDTSGNMPLARMGTRASWADSCGCFFMGGHIPGGFTYYYNDLWYINTEMDEFTWLSGSASANVPCSYGMKGVSSPSNSPCPRSGALPFRDGQGNLWLFGGQGTGSDYYNDLWMYTVDTSCVQLCKYNLPVSVEEFDHKNSRTYVYPNPADEVLRIAGAEKISFVKIYDMSGRLMKNVSVNKDNSISVSLLPDGLYILHFEENDMRFAKRFVVSHK